MRAKDVVRKLLSVARKTPSSRRPIRIYSIIKESLDLLRKTIPATIEIRTTLQCSTETVLADPTEISQVLMNLCTNSAHAMIGGAGVLEVRLETVKLDRRHADRYEDLHPGDYVQLTVADTGKGIEPDIIERIFDPYFTTKDVDEGLGMGLAVVYGIVKKHEGAIEIESQPGKGTRVDVLFPLTEAKPDSRIREPNSISTGTERVLLVDDESLLLKMIEQMIKRCGYKVHPVKSSTDALKLFREDPSRFDLVITDMSMPEMAGDQLAREMIQVRPDIPVILCTGHSDRIDEDSARELGIRDFIMKPFTRSDIANAVRRVLDGSGNTSP